MDQIFKSRVLREWGDLPAEKRRDENFRTSFAFEKARGQVGKEDPYQTIQAWLIRWNEENKHRES